MVFLPRRRNAGKAPKPAGRFWWKWCPERNSSSSSSSPSSSSSLAFSSGSLDLGRLGCGGFGGLGFGRLSSALLLHLLLLLRLFRLLLLLRCSHSLLSLGIPDFGFLVSLGHDVGKSGAGDGPHELLRPPRPLLGSFFNHAFAVLTAVQHRPVDLSGISLQGMIPLAFAAEEDLRLSVCSANALPVAGVNLQARKRANLNLQHF